MIRLEKVSKFYHSENNLAVGLKNISLQFNMGEFVAIVGESGSGKSTLLNILSGLDTYEDGEMYFKGEETSHYSIEDLEEYRNNNVSFIFQKYNLIKGLSVYKNIELALVLSGYPGDIDSRIKELVEKVGLTDRIKNKASQLSGGERQRVVIARALANDTNIIVADEPTGNLDSKNSKEVIELLKEVSKEKLVLIVTHDYDEVKDYASRKIVMHDGIVQSDTELRDFDLIEEIPELNRKNNISILSSLKLALSNLIGTKRKSVLFTTIYTIFMFALVLSMIMFTMMPFSAIYSNYSNSENLIFVSSENGPLTKSDRDILEGYTNENTTYLQYGSMVASSFRMNDNNYDYYAYDLEYADISQLDSNKKLTRDGIKIYGDIPSNYDEVVVPINREYDWLENKIGTMLTVSYDSYDFISGFYNSFSQNVKIVGYYYQDFSPLEINHEVYFHDSYMTYLDNSISNSITYYYTNESYYANRIYTGNYSKQFYFEIDNTVEDDVIILDNWDANSICNNLGDSTYSMTGEICESYLTTSNAYLGNEVVITSYGLSYQLEDDFVYGNYSGDTSTRVNQKTYDNIYSAITPNVSFYSPDKASREELIEALENDGYLVTYNIYESSIRYKDEAQEVIMLQVIVIAATLGVAVITKIFISKIVNSKTEEYNLIRSNGARKNTLRKIMFVEYFIILVLSFILTLILVSLISYISLYFYGLLPYTPIVYLIFLVSMTAYIYYKSVTVFVNDLYQKSITEGLSRGEKL